MGRGLQRRCQLEQDLELLTANLQERPAANAKSLGPRRSVRVSGCGAARCSGATAMLAMHAIPNLVAGLLYNDVWLKEPITS